jgi:hypothetical protein
VLDIHRRWRLYQAREYYAFALNALFYYFCDWGLAQNGDIRPVHLSQFWQHLESALDFDGLADWFDLSRPGLGANANLQQLLDWLLGLVGAEQADFDTACTIDQPVHEHRLMWSARHNPRVPALMVAGTVTMLALIYLRFGQPELWQQPEWSISRMGSDGRLSLDQFVRTLRRKVKVGLVNIFELVKELYTDYIILQHQLVASSKLPDNTFRFQREGDWLRFFSLHNSLEFMDSRFDALSTTVHELGLCGDLRRPDHPLTAKGEQLLTTGDLS